MKKILTTFVLGISILFGSGEIVFSQENDIVSLYRNSVVIENTKIKIATFNANEKTWKGTRFDYNMGKC